MPIHLRGTPPTPPPPQRIPARPRFATLPALLASTLTLASTLLRLAAQSHSLPLAARIDSILHTPPTLPSPTWGIEIRSLDSGTLLYATNAHHLLVPASNAKLFTAALALDRLGPDFRIPTALLATSKPEPDGSLTGNLVVLGAGDPTLQRPLPSLPPSTTLAHLVTLAADNGIRAIRGNLIADARAFHGPPYGSGWAWEDLQSDDAPPTSALTLDDNIISILVEAGPTPGSPGTARLLPPTRTLVLLTDLQTTPADSTPGLLLRRLPGADTVTIRGTLPVGARVTRAVTLSRPAAFFAEQLATAFAHAGIVIHGTTLAIEGHQPERPSLGDPLPTPPPSWFDAGYRELAAHYSDPVERLVATMMKPSNNLHAQLLLLRSGATAVEYPSDNEPVPPRYESTEAAGLAALGQFLARNGINPAEVQLTEGSGLSRENAVSPAAIVALLRQMARHPATNAWMEALPVAGIDGTLQNRFPSGNARGRVRAKTGSLHHVQALSGYARPQQNPAVAFSILVNGWHGPAADCRARIDRIVEALVSE